LTRGQTTATTAAANRTAGTVVDALPRTTLGSTYALGALNIAGTKGQGTHSLVIAHVVAAFFAAGALFPVVFAGRARVGRTIGSARSAAVSSPVTNGPAVRAALLTTVVAADPSVPAVLMGAPVGPAAVLIARIGTSAAAGEQERNGDNQLQNTHAYPPG
jgi:hypothetical protein